MRPNSCFLQSMKSPTKSWRIYPFLEIASLLLVCRWWHRHGKLKVLFAVQLVHYRWRLCAPQGSTVQMRDWLNAEWTHGCYEGEIGHRDKNNVVAEIGRISTGVCWDLTNLSFSTTDFDVGRLLAHLLAQSAKKLMNTRHVTVSVSFSVCNTGCSSERVCVMITERVITKITLKVKV